MRTENSSKITLTLEPGELILISGKPSRDKTDNLLKLAEKESRKTLCGFFSFEHDPLCLTQKLVSQMTGIDLHKIKNHNLSAEELDAFSGATHKLSSNKLELIYAAGMTARDIENIAIERGYKVIFVDFLQLINSGGSITPFELKLRKLAQKHEVCVVAIDNVTGVR